MGNGLDRMGRRRALEMFADWTDRILAGEVPPGAGATPRCGAQRRHDPMGLGRPEGVSPRRDFHRQAESHGQRQRPYLRRARGQRGLPGRPGSSAAHGEPGAGASARSRHADGGRATTPAVTVLGRRSDLGTAGPTCTIRCSIIEDGSGSPRESRPRENPAFCQEGSDHPSAQLFPVAGAGRHLAVYDPTTRAVHAHRHVFQHAPFGLCRGCQPHVVDQRWRPGHRLAEYEDARRNRR